MLKINGNKIFCVADAVKAGYFNIQYYPREENLGDYPKANTISVHTIQQFAPGTCMKRCHFENYQEPASLALWKGVLESSQMGTNGKIHYHKFPLIRVSQQVGKSYLVTLDSQ